MTDSTLTTKDQPLLCRGSPSCDGYSDESTDESSEGLPPAFDDAADAADVADVLPRINLFPLPQTVQAGAVLQIVIDLHGLFSQNRKIRAVATLLGPNAEGKLLGDTTVIGVSVSPILIRCRFSLIISGPGVFSIGIRLEEEPFGILCGHVHSGTITVSASNQQADPDSSHIRELSRPQSKVALLKPNPRLPKRGSDEHLCGGIEKKPRSDECTVQVRRRPEHGGKTDAAVSTSAEAPTSTEVGGDRSIEDGMAGETARSRFRSDDRERDKLSVDSDDDPAVLEEIEKKLNETKKNIRERREWRERKDSGRLAPQEVINKVLIWEEPAQSLTGSFDREFSHMQQSAVDGEPTNHGTDEPLNQVSTRKDDIPPFTNSLLLLHCREENNDKYIYDDHFRQKVCKSPVEVGGYFYTRNEILLPEATILNMKPGLCEVDGISERGKGLYSDKEGNWYSMSRNEYLSDVDDEDQIWEENGIEGWKYCRNSELFQGLWVRLMREVVVVDSVRYIAHFVLSPDETDRTTGTSSDC